MLTLGDVLAACRRSAAGADLLQFSPELASEIRAAAAAEGLSPAHLLRWAVADFSQQAGPADWTTLMARLRNDSDPGAACLAFMMQRWLRAGAGRTLQENGGRSHG